MEFEPSYRYLISLLSITIGKEEASKSLDESIRSARLPKQLTYEIDDFIKICEELKKEKKSRTIGTASIASARFYSIYRRAKEIETLKEKRLKFR